MIATARMKYLRSSAQKTRLVVDQIRGLGVNQALSVLRESPKSVARDVLKVLRSAVANAAHGDQRVDADTLVVRRAVVDGGPVLKRIRPATFGRAFRVLHRTCHVTLELEAVEGAGPRQSRAKRRAGAARAARVEKSTAGARGGAGARKRTAAPAAGGDETEGSGAGQD